MQSRCNELPQKGKEETSRLQTCMHIISGFWIASYNPAHLFEIQLVSTQFAVAVVESMKEGDPVFLIRQRPETGSSILSISSCVISCNTV